MVEDIRDALLEYQVGSEKSHAPLVTNAGAVQQTAQQQAVYDQNCRLIVSDRTGNMRKYLIVKLVPRMQVRFAIFTSDTASPVHPTAELSALNSCRRAPGAGYQHGDRRGCLRGTRETVLNEIESWTKDFHKAPVFWLNGLAGTGKSAIAQTVSERTFADGLLGASFFCSRDFTDRSDLNFIFPTLAFQLAHKYPSFRSVLVPLLQSNPDVTHESLFNQMGKLIVEPLRSAGISTVIVIDALDECKDEEPSSAILSMLGRFVERIPRVKFFITGRPEPRIKTGFRLPLLIDSTDVFVLHDVHPALINDDIRLFIKHELSELAQRRRLDRWPSNEQIDLLCHRAAGLFVYAVATVKFLDSKAQLPKRRLEVITGLPECTGHEGQTRFNSNMTLDSLYTSILETAFGEEDPEIYSRVRSTIGAIVLLANPLPPVAIAKLIGLDPEEVILFLTLAHSLLAIDEDFSQPVKPFHKSFPDFVTNPSRCADVRFYISPGNLHFELVVDCLRLMNEGLNQNILSFPDYALNSEVEDLQTRIDDRISIALQYACKSWYSHLTKTMGEAIDIVSYLHVFLKEKFLAWLEVLSILGAMRVAIVALEEVIHWLQVSRNEELLDITSDYFQFVTKFFKPISISATHIYHSALELSPTSSIIRRLYHHQRHTLFPRVVAGTADSWDEGIHLSTKSHYQAYTWSPCGQFVAALSGNVVEIRDALSAELVSTLTAPNAPPKYGLAYSPDGQSLAGLSDTLIIWDIQTGGVAKGTPWNTTGDSSMVWSLDGGMIGVIEGSTCIWTVHIYNVASGTTQSPGTLESSDKLRIWAHKKSFQVMATQLDGQIFTVEIFEVGSDLTKTESFHIKSWEDPKILSFSPTTYRVSIWDHSMLRILDVQNSECQLEEKGRFGSHCFSSNGNLFAAADTGGKVHIWKYGSGCYTMWRELQYLSAYAFPPQFSPTSSLILGGSVGFLYVCRLDGPPLVYPSHVQLSVLSSCGTYMVTSHKLGDTITITNLLSQTPPQFIDTDMGARYLGLTGNILLMFSHRAIVAWRLTEVGMVDGCPPNRRVGHGDSIWTVSTTLHILNPIIMFEDQTAIFEVEGDVIHAYHTGTGEVLDTTKINASAHHPRYESLDIHFGCHYLHYRKADKKATLPEDDWPVQLVSQQAEWVKDPGGKHQLWLPAQWRTCRAGWLHNITTLWLKKGGEAAIIML